jgi:FixJ family two-component response regulator
MTTARANVYIVDDDFSFRRGLERVLRSANLNGVAFASVDHFFQSVSERRNSCLVVDVKMPGGGALEMLTRLRKECIRIPVIVVTAHDDPKIRKEAQDRGAIGFFRKPVDSEALLDAITWALGSREEEEH